MNSVLYLLQYLTVILKFNIMMSNMFPLSLPPSLRYLRLGGFGLLSIFRIGYFGFFYTWHIEHAIITIHMYFKRNKYCMYAF